jgi:glutamate decarboxylase
VGLPVAAGCVDQHLRAQVRAGLSGAGWAVWRDAEALPEELILKVNYLGGEMPTLALNFSRPGGQVVAQYYTFRRLGQEGFRQVQQECRDNATYTSARIEELGPFRLLTRGDELPVLATPAAMSITPAMIAKSTACKAPTLSR